MIITCPACSARFNVADHMIGDTGRVVRCAKCGHKWHQMPEGMEGMAPPPKPAPPPPPPKPAPRPPAQKGMGPSPLPKLGDIPLEMPAQGQMPSHEAPDDGESMEDVDLAAALERVAGEIAESDAHHTFQSNATPKSGGDDSSGGQNLPDDFDFGEAEPIPEVFTKSSVKTKPAGGRAFGPLLMLLTLIVVVGGLAGGAYYFRQDIVEIWPDAAALYESVGIEAEALGSGFKFRNVTSERVSENNVEMLVVRGVIANISDKTRDLPLVKLSLYDSANMVVQERTAPPPERALAPNESTGFKISIESPPSAARRFEVTFAPRPGQE